MTRTRPARGAQPLAGLLVVLVAACFADPPPPDGAAETNGECAPEVPEGCVELFLDGSLEDWRDDVPEPTGWDVYDGEIARLDDDEAACAPAMLVVAGPPRDDGVVWELGQDIADTPVAAGSTVRFTATFELLEGELGVPRICFIADPANICADVLGFHPNGESTVMADIDLLEDDVQLVSFTIGSSARSQQVRIDDLSLLVCSP